MLLAGLVGGKRIPESIPEQIETDDGDYLHPLGNH